MLRIGLEVFEFLILLGNAAVALQRGTPKAVYELIAFAHLLKPMPNLPIELNSAFEFAPFGLLQHEFRPTTRREHTLARVSDCQSRQNCPQRKQNCIHDCCEKIAPAARFKHGTRRSTECSRMPFWPRLYPSRIHINCRFRRPRGNTLSKNGQAWQASSYAQRRSLKFEVMSSPEVVTFSCRHP